MNNLILIITISSVISGILFLLFLLVARSNHLKTTVNETIKDKVILKIAVPLKNEKGPLAAEQLYQSLHGILRGATKSVDHYSLEIVAAYHGIYFIVVCGQRYQKFIENQIYAQYPDAQIVRINDYTDTLRNNPGNIQITELGLSREFFLPIRTFQSFEVDPLASITAAISKLEPGFEVWIQLLARPVDSSWHKVGINHITTIKGKTDSEGKKVEIDPAKQAELGEIEKKNTKVGFQFLIRILVKGPDAYTVKLIMEDTEASFKQFQTAQFNSLGKSEIKISTFTRLFLGKRAGDRLNKIQKYALRFLDEREAGIVNIEEVASIYHLPNTSVQTPNIAWAKSRKLEYPLNIPRDNARIFGLTDYRNIHIPFGLKKEDRRRHMYLLGKTGTGKSTLLKNMIVGDILDGQGLAVIDPHGDLVEEILDLIPEHRIKDLVYLDPSDTEFPIGLNMLDLKEGESIDLLADGIVSVFKKFFDDSWGPRLQYILTNTIQTLLYCQNVSLLAVQRILVDKNYRSFLLKQVKDPFMQKFWSDEFDEIGKNPRMLAEAISPIQNKVGRFLASPMVRNMIGQIKSNIDLQDIMNNGKIFLVNLSQGKIGEENSSLLGGLIVTRLYTNAMQRAFMNKDERRDFYLYVDEFQNFATDTFIKILSEARKYGLNLIVTHQYIDQLSPEIQNSIFGNVGTLMNYVVGPQDAGRLEKEYSPHLTADDLVNLERFRLVLKMTIDGSQSAPFTALALKPSFTEFNLKDQAKAFIRNTYASPREEVESKLNKWASQRYSNTGNLVQVDENGNVINPNQLEKKDQTNLNPNQNNQFNKKPEGQPNTPTQQPKPPVQQTPNPQQQPVVNQPRPNVNPMPQAQIQPQQTQKNNKSNNNKKRFGNKKPINNQNKPQNNQRQIIDQQP